MRKTSRKGTNSLCPHQAECRWPSHQVRSSFWGDYPCHCQVFGIQVTVIFKPCEDYRVCKKAVACSKILGKRLFFNIISPSIPTFGGKKYWLLVIEDITNYVWSCFSKEKFDLVSVMMGLIKNLKAMYNIQVHHLHCDNTGENIAFKKPTNKKGWGWRLSIQPQVLPNRMAKWNRSLLPSSIGYMLCSMAGNSPLFWEIAYGLKPPTLPCVLRVISSIPIEL